MAAWLGDSVYTKTNTQNNSNSNNFSLETLNNDDHSDITKELFNKSSGSLPSIDKEILVDSATAKIQIEIVS